MKSVFILLLLMLVIKLNVFAQSTRYFEFTTSCGHGNWQDTSFIAATNNQSVIDFVMLNLSRPMEERNFINGPIAPGSDGYNHNASHWFKWHFISNQWNLVEFAIEVCDGCPYTDVDADTAYWIRNIGQFCPWSGRPVREVFLTGINSEVINNLGFNVYPNPSSVHINLGKNLPENTEVIIFNLSGVEVLRKQISNNEPIEIHELKNGIYFVRYWDGKTIFSQKFCVLKS
jgi:hypothetical protein